MILFIALCIISIYTRPLTPAEHRKYCDSNDAAFQSRNSGHIRGIGNWQCTAHISLSLNPNDDDTISNEIATFPYNMIAKYDDPNCQFAFESAYATYCDASTCPSLPEGVYYGLSQSSLQLNLPDAECDSGNYVQKYTQGWKTPFVPGTPDQTEWGYDHHDSASNWYIGFYYNRTTREKIFMEVTTCDVPNQHKTSLSNQYIPSTLYPGTTKNILIVTGCYGVTKFAEPYQTLYDMYHNGTLTCLEYAPGKCSYMIPAPPSNKRTDQTSSLATTLKMLRTKLPGLKLPL
jgi:hypothetical protein